jgi:hypothetical protein
MRQRVADIVQLAAAPVFALAGFTVNVTVGLVATSVALVVVGVVVERS